MTSIKGIDVSQLQGEINWDKVKESGEVQFAFIKTGEGATITDTKSRFNALECDRVGIPFGYYHFAYPQKKEGDAVEEAKMFKQRLSHLPQTYFGYALDVEVNPEHMSPSEYVIWIEEFMEEFMTEYGQTNRMFIYSYPAFMFENLPANHTLGVFKLWIAQYGPKQPIVPHGWDSYDIWQYSGIGSISGITPCVDLNVAVSDLIEEVKS